MAWFILCCSSGGTQSKGSAGGYPAGGDAADQQRDEAHPEGSTPYFVYYRHFRLLALLEPGSCTEINFQSSEISDMNFVPATNSKLCLITLEIFFFTVTITFACFFVFCLLLVFLLCVTFSLLTSILHFNKFLQKN